MPSAVEGRGVGVVLVCVLYAAVRAHATVVVPASLAELTSEAHAIARGRVVAVEGRVAGGGRRIETLVTLDADAWLKGRPGGEADTVQFWVPGGQVGRYRRIVLGAPEFAVGQRVIVFLGGNAPRMPHVIGLGQGVFRLSASFGRWMVRGGATGSLPLETFEQRVLTIAGAAR